MESKKTTAPNPLLDKSSSSIDHVQLDKVKDILHVLANAVSAAKLFPSEHQSVGNFLSELYDQMRKFLDEYGQLELGIEEHAFTYGGKRIYEDPQPVKSLPFFFFKDGMKMLNFFKGMEKEELKGLLETVRKVSQLPPEESDIVIALWERDFPNIRHFAPDNYLEGKIGVGRPALAMPVNVHELYEGRIELTPEDLEDVRQAGLALDRSKDKDPDRVDHPRHDEIKSILTPADEREMQEIESLLLSNRRLSPQEEYLNLIIEIIYLEDRTERFPAIADVLEQYHQEIMQKKDFVGAARLLRALAEVKEVLLKKNRLKAELVDSLISLLSRGSTLTDLQESLDLNSLADPEGYLAYLNLFGTQAAPLVADIYDWAKNPDLRRKALDLLKKIGRADKEALMRLAQESRPALTREIIILVGENQDLSTITFLANFLVYKNPTIKLEAIRALGKAKDEAADKFLLGFLSNPEEEVRTAALDNLKATRNPQITQHLLRIVTDKTFKKKHAREKKAAVTALGRTDTDEACYFLQNIVRKPPFLPTSGHVELCLFAAAALEIMTLPAAKEALKDGAKRRNRKVREACLQALQRKSESATSFLGRPSR